MREEKWGSKDHGRVIEHQNGRGNGGEGSTANWSLGELVKFVEVEMGQPKLHMKMPQGNLFVC